MVSPLADQLVISRRQAPARCTLAVAALSALVWCGCSSDPVTGASEPLRVTNAAGGDAPPATFIAGDLPGDPPPPEGESPEPPTEDGPATVLTFTTYLAPYAGAKSVAFSGTTTVNAASVGMRFPELGTGYWVVPTGDLDQATGNGAYQGSFDLDPTVPAGYYDLFLVAFDEAGNPGQQYRSSRLCIRSRTPDNFNYCESSKKPPAAVISLSWDNAADLDLEVVTPEGVVVSPKNPTTVPEGEESDPPLPVGAIDRDANVACTGGQNQENLVWMDAPPSGEFQIFANLFDSCRQPAVRFNVKFYLAVETGEGEFVLEMLYSKSGEIIDFQANAGNARGLFVTSFIF
jgi:hypothetical protein